MIYYKPIPFVLQADDFPHRRRDLNYSGHIMLPEFGHYFFNAFLVGVPTARARRTGEAMGCLVSSEEQYPTALQTFDAHVIKERVIPFRWLPPRSEGRMRDRCRTICCVWPADLFRVANREGFTPTVLLPDKVIVGRSIRGRVGLNNNLDVIWPECRTRTESRSDHCECLRKRSHSQCSATDRPV